MAPKRLLIAAAVAASAIAPAAALAAAPANDDFANAQALAGAFGTVPGTNVDATEQAGSGEPDHAGSGFGPAHSVWYRWEPGALRGTSVTLDTCGSTFDTRLAVYYDNGPDMTALTAVAANNDSAGANCAGSKASEVSFPIPNFGPDYYIAVDTNGEITRCPGQTRGAFQLRLDGSASVTDLACGGGTAPPPSEQPPAETPPNVTAAQPLAPNAVRFQAPDFAPDCRENKPIERRCKFKSSADVFEFLRPLEDKRVPTGYTEQKLASGEAPGGMKTSLRASGKGGEIFGFSVRLEGYDGSNSVALEPGKEYDVQTGQNRILRVYADVFDPAKDKAAIADTKKDIKDAGPAKPKNSKCWPIKWGMKPSELANALLPSGILTSFEQARGVLAKLGCTAEIGRYVDARIGERTPHVTGVLGFVKDRDVVTLEYAQPRSQDFLFTIREDPDTFTDPNNLALGNDGALTQHPKQPNGFTVQVLQRATGDFVSGLPITFRTPKDKDGKQLNYTARTNPQGEAAFNVRVPENGEAMLEVNFGTMTGHRAVSVLERRGNSFRTMAGRTLTQKKDGKWVGAVSELVGASSLPVVPANLGTGLSGLARITPAVAPNDVLVFDSKGSEYAARQNAVGVRDDSNMIIGAAPGMVLIGNGLADAGSFESPEPYALLASLVTPLRVAIEKRIGTVDRALAASQQALVSQMAQILSQPPPAAELISENGLGVIASDGASVVASDGASVAQVNGADIISDNGASLRNNTLIGQAGGNAMPVDGGRLIGQAGGNLIGQAGGN